METLNILLWIRKSIIKGVNEWLVNVARNKNSNGPQYCVVIQMQFCFYTQMQSITFLYTRKHLV